MAHSAPGSAPFTASSPNIASVIVFFGSRASSSAGCNRNSRLYSTTGGHAPYRPKLVLIVGSLGACPLVVE